MIDLSKCQLTLYPAQILTERAMEIEVFDSKLGELADMMLDIMLENKGIGLAGPQVNMPLRIFVVSLDATRGNSRVYVNPVITPAGDIESMEEGCLSVPGIYTGMKRYKQCKITAKDLNGKSFTEETEALYARCLQHEYDHLEGVTLITRMSATAKLIHRRQIKKLENAG